MGIDCRGEMEFKARIFEHMSDEWLYEFSDFQSCIAIEVSLFRPLLRL